MPGLPPQLHSHRSHLSLWTQRDAVNTKCNFNKQECQQMHLLFLWYWRREASPTCLSLSQLAIVVWIREIFRIFVHHGGSRRLEWGPLLLCHAVVHTASTTRAISLALIRRCGHWSSTTCRSLTAGDLGGLSGDAAGGVLLHRFWSDWRL